MKRPRLCAGVRRRAYPEFYEKGTVRLQMEEKRETAATSVPGGEPNELYTKQIFSDAPVKPSEQSGETAAPAAEAETIAFDKPTVLDESFAARKAAPPAAEPAPARAPRPAAPRRTAQRRTLPKHLYSGETPKQAARHILRELSVLLVFVLLVCGGFWLKDLAAAFLTDDAYTTIYQSSKYAEPVSTAGLTVGDTAENDGFAAAQIVCAKLGAPVADDALAVKTEVVFPSEIAACMESALSAERVQLRTGMSNRDLLVQIYESLRADRPVIVLLAAADGEDMRLQYAVVTALDAEADAISVLNPSRGVETTYSIADFLAATRFEAYEDMPFSVRLGLTFGSWSRNTAIFAE